MPRKMIKGGKLNKKLMIGLGLLVLVAVIVVVSLFATGVFGKNNDIDPVPFPDKVLERASKLVATAKLGSGTDRFTDKTLCGQSITINDPTDFDVNQMDTAIKNRTGNLYDALKNLFGEDTDDFLEKVKANGGLEAKSEGQGMAYSTSLVIGKIEEAAKNIATGDWRTNPDKLVKLMQLFYLMYNNKNSVLGFQKDSYIIKYNNILYIVYNPEESDCKSIDELIRKGTPEDLSYFMINFIDFTDDWLNR